MMLQMILGGQTGVMFRLPGMSLGTLGFVRGRLVVAGSIGLLGCPMMPRGALVMLRGVAVMLCGTLRHWDLWNCPVVSVQFAT